MNLSQCSLRQSLVFHCSWSPEGCKDWMPLSALGQAPHHLKCQLKKAKKSCEYVWSMDKVKDIPHHMGVVGGGRFGRIGTRKSKWRLWRTYKSTVEDSAFQLQSLTHPSPIKTNLDILPSPLKNQSVLTLHMYFASVWNTKSGVHLWILTREAIKLQSYGYILLSVRKLSSLWVRVKRFFALKFQLPVLIV